MISGLLALLISISIAESEIYLRSLSDVSSKKITYESPRPVGFIIFQKDCQACRKQVQDLQCLEPVIDIFLVGAFSSEKQLRKEYQRFNTLIPGVYGDHDFKKIFSIRNGLTPQIVLSFGNFVKSIVGITPCGKILDIFKNWEKSEAT